MPQARGSQSQIVVGDEDSYKTTAVYDGSVVHHVGCSVGSSQNKIKDPTINADRKPNRPIPGNVDAGGNLKTTLAAEDCGKMQKYTFGAVATWRPAIVSGTPNIAGITAMYAETTCPTGNGSLAYVNAGTTLAWTANGDTAGSAVDVSAGGTFTLESGSVDQALVVVVDAASLPGSDQSDTVDVIVSNEHHFSIGSSVASFWMDRDHGQSITNRYELIEGCRVGSMALDVPQEGPVTAVYAIKGANEAFSASAADASPDDPGHETFSAGMIATMEENGTTLANIESMQFTHSNNLDEAAYVITPGGTGNERADLPEGDAEVSGQLVALFADTSLLEKAINNTESDLRVVLKRGSGDGTTGNGYFAIELGAVEFERNAIDQDGPAGVRVTLGFMGYGADAIKTIVRNQVASY